MSFLLYIDIEKNAFIAVISYYDSLSHCTTKFLKSPAYAHAYLGHKFGKWIRNKFEYMVM